MHAVDYTCAFKPCTYTCTYTYTYTDTQRVYVLICYHVYFSALIKTKAIMHKAGLTKLCVLHVGTVSSQDSVRSVVIDSCIRVAESGKERMHKNIFFTFTLYNALVHNDQLKFGASSSEEISRWIQSFTEASLKVFPSDGKNDLVSPIKRGKLLRLNRTMNRSRTHSIDWTTISSAHTDPKAPDVIDSSAWSIFGCTNGLRLFKQNWDHHSAIMAVGVVDANAEAVFQTLMSLGPSRSEWDFCLSRGSIIERLNDNTDIIHKKLLGDWLPRRMTKRDLLLRRCWRREDDGTYAIVYHSVFHPSCRSERGYVRACIKNGGYVVSPVNQGKQSVVKHILAIDWKSWKSYLFASSDEYITIRMLARVAALREFFRAQLDNGARFNYSSGYLTRDIGLTQNDQEEIKREVHSGCEKNKEDPIEELQHLSPKCWDMAESFLQLSEDSEEESQYFSPAWDMGDSCFQLSDVADEFFDVPGEYELDQSEATGFSNEEMQSQVPVPAASIIGKGLRGYPATSIDDMSPCCYGTTLPKDTSCTMCCSWTSADPTTFLIRGASYLQDRQKIKSERTLMEMVAADWLKSDNREDDLGGRRGGIVQKSALQDPSKFFFIVNIQVPGSGSSMYSLSLYYRMDSPLENVPLLQSFIKGDDAYRNSRFKLIPFISKGSWIVKQSVGRKACLMGQALKLNYFQGRNYFEVDIDVSSSAVAKRITGLVLNYLNSLVVEMGFIIQGNTEEELPEVLLGTCRLNHMDASKAVTVGSSLRQD